jgi:plastocyanin
MPRNVTIAVGTTVVWDWNDNESHSVTSDTGLFDSGLLVGTDKQFTLTFDTVGTFPYFCFVHGLPGVGMFGQVTVQ